jgi:hypothetical protein
MRVRKFDPVDEARRWLFVRETLGPNRGVFVEAIQRIGDGKPGDSWCMDFLSMVLWICYQGPAPLPRTGSCDVAFAMAKSQGYLVKTPQPNDVFFRVRDFASAHEDAHHVGFVTAVYPDRIGSIAGNTNEDGLSSNGTGVFEHDLPLSPSLVFVRLPLSL